MICGNILGSITERKKKKENPTHSMIYKNMGVSTYSSPRPQATLLTLNATRISIKGQRQGCRSPKVFTSGFSDLTTHHVMKKTRAQTRQCLGFPSLCATLVLCIHNSPFGSGQNSALFTIWWRCERSIFNWHLHIII